MKSQVLHTVWCNTSAEAAGEILSWSLFGVKGKKPVGKQRFSIHGRFASNRSNRSYDVWIPCVRHPRKTRPEMMMNSPRNAWKSCSHQNKTKTGFRSLRIITRPWPDLLWTTAENIQFQASDGNWLDWHADITKIKFNATALSCSVPLASRDAPSLAEALSPTCHAPIQHYEARGIENVLEAWKPA